MDNYRYENEDLHITNEAARLLAGIAGWTRFLSILAFVFIIIFALAILGGAVVTSSVDYYEMVRGFGPYTPGMMSWGYVVLYILMLLVYTVPVYYLFKFSNKIKNAIKSHDTSVLTDAIRYLKMHYTYIGILTIIWLVMFVITCITMGLGMASVNM